jgi:hypothetical protein
VRSGRICQPDGQVWQQYHIEGYKLGFYNPSEASAILNDSLQTLLAAIAILLFLILWKLIKIDRRLKERFPTEEEQDYEWSKKDPMGHWEAHKNDKEK